MKNCKWLFFNKNWQIIGLWVHKLEMYFFFFWGRGFFFQVQTYIPLKIIGRLQYSEKYSFVFFNNNQL